MACSIWPVWAGSMMKSRMRPVVTITSQTAALYPLFVRIRRCPMMPLSVPAIMVRTWFRSCGGKRSISRLIVSVASKVWSVLRTRWPVSAAERDIWALSASLISPISITSGSCLSTRLKARAKEALRAVQGARRDRTRDPGRDEVPVRVGLRRPAFPQGCGLPPVRRERLPGRTGIYEVMVISDEIRKMILLRSSAGEISRVAESQGMVRLRDDGLLKAAKGITTIEEALKTL